MALSQSASIFPFVCLSVICHLSSVICHRLSSVSQTADIVTLSVSFKYGKHSVSFRYGNIRGVMPCLVCNKSINNDYTELFLKRKLNIDMYY